MRGAFPFASARLVVGLALALAGCAVDDNGLGTKPMLQRDGGHDLMGTADGSAAGAGGAGGGSAGASGNDASDDGLASDASGTGGAAGGTGGAAGGTGGAAGGTGGAAGGAGGVAGGAGGAAGRGGGPGGSAGGRGGGAGGTGGATVICGPANCPNGCCASDQCITNRTSQQCGAAGVACAACAPCDTCNAMGACHIDPASKWIVIAGSAQMSVNPPQGKTWDSGGLPSSNPDPFCEFEMPPGNLNFAGVTDTLLDTFTAVWNETITPVGQTIRASDLMSPNSGAWVVWVGDDEFNGLGDVACQIHPPMQEAWLHAGQASYVNVGNCASVNLQLVCQP